MDKLLFKFKDKVLKEIELTGKTIKIGRDADNNIIINNSAISRHHAKIEQVKGNYLLSDLNSTNGTFVNKKRINQVMLKGGEEITVGKHTILFESDKKYEEKANVPDFGGTMILDTQQQKELLDSQLQTPSTSTQVKHAKLIVSQHGKEEVYNLTKEVTIIGKSPSSDVVISGFLVPQMAATIKKESNSYYISGYGGWIKVNVNGKIVGKNWKLYPNDTIEVRKVKIVFLDK